MTVKELIDQLRRLPPDMPVILQKDSEGNGYSPLADVDQDAIYVAENAWSGEVYSTNFDYSDNGFETHDDWVKAKADNPRCCVLSPIN